jgi:hypothetical protein
VADLDRAREYLDANARLLDRHRFDLLVDDGDPDALLTTLASYANPDGGFGWGLHPDLRTRSSQPVAAIHAFETLEEAAEATSPLAAGLCDWLEGASLDDGSLPFAVSFSDAAAASTPMWAETDTTSPSLLITAAVCAPAHRIADRYPEVAEHPWLAAATDFCMEQIAGMREAGMAIVFKFALHLLDALHGRDDRADAELERLGAMVPPSATMAVPGGAEGESMRPLDFSPEPDRPLRDYIGAETIDDALDALDAEQSPDGNWEVDFTVYSPAAVLEWRGDATVRAVKVLRANGRVEAGSTA